MRVYFIPGKCTYPKGGANTGCTYMYFNGGAVCIARRYRPVPEMPQNITLKERNRLGLLVWSLIPRRVKRDFSEYAKQYKKDYPKFRRKHLGAYSIFLKVFHSWIIANDLTDMKTVNAEDILLSLRGYSLIVFIRMGFLLPVKGEYQLNACIIRPDQPVFYIPKSDKSPLDIEKNLCFDEKVYRFP